jgi:membrane-associated protein
VSFFKFYVKINNSYGKINEQELKMSVLQNLIYVILHLNPTTLGAFMKEYGIAAYVILFLIIFCETGLVVTPFLPGDSLIFAAGTLAAFGAMSWNAYIMLIFAAILGNMLNYQIGKSLSEKVNNQQKIKFIKSEYIDDTRNFFDKYGAVTIIITRFMPIIRTFAPFVAGVGEMKYRRFFIYNAIGGISWVTFFFIGGYFFGRIPAVQQHFSLVVIGIVLISVLPAVILFLKKTFGKSKPKTPEE